MPYSSRKRTAAVLGLAAAASLAGCTVGPNYKAPGTPAAAGYAPTLPKTTASAPTVAKGATQTFVPGQDIPGQWWTVFHNHQLEELVERSLRTNPNIKAAQAALVVARETTLAQKGFYYPQVSAGFSGDHSKTAASVSSFTASGALYYSLFTPSLNVSFSPDVFGLNRRSVESLQADQQGARFALAATHITLSSNVVVAAIQEASLRAQVEATQEIIRENQAMLAALHQQFDRGYASGLDVANQEQQLAQAEQELPPLLRQLAQGRDLLANLAGAYPGQDLPETFTMDSLTLPTSLPLSLPSQLIAQRPDVQQAQANLHAACALIGVAQANRLPNFLITGDIGSMSLIFTHMFMDGNSFYDAALGVTQPVFDGGTLKHRERAARAAYVQAAAQYESTVQAAFQNVADTLHALDQDAHQLQTAAHAADASRRALSLTQDQYRDGYTDYVTLLNVQQVYQQSLLAVTQAQATRLADTAALFQALGGGWWHRGEIPQA